MRKTTRSLALSVMIAASAGSAAAQGLPTTQPKMLMVIREEVKPGHGADHARVEAGWPAAYEKAKSPYYYLAMTSMTGTNEAWFVSPFDSNAAIGDSYKRESEDPVLAAELARLQKADAEHISGLRTMLATARPDLSYGAYPDTATQRFWEITIFRVRPGHDAEFEAAAKVYGAAAKRASSRTAFRVYEVMAGMPGSTFLVFGSVKSLGDFDGVMTAGEATMKAFTPEEAAGMQKFLAQGLINSETQRFRLDPAMSYVPKETRDTDPAFWIPKKTMAKPAPKPTQP